MNDMRTKAEREQQAGETYMFRGKYFVSDGSGGFKNLQGEKVSLPKDADPERFGVAGLGPRTAEGTLQATHSVDRGGNTVSKEGASGSGVALEDADEKQSSSVDERGTMNLTNPKGEQVAIERPRPFAIESEPLDVTDTSGKKQSRSPSQRRSQARDKARGKGGSR